MEKILAVPVMNNGEPAAVQLIAMGGVNTGEIPVPEISKLVLLSNCPGVLLLHNHPSGNVEPSAEDQRITERIEAAGQLLVIHLIDHIIMADRYYRYSIKCGKKLYSNIRKGA